MSKTIEEYKLKFPFKYGESNKEKVDIRRPTAGDMRGLKPSKLEDDFDEQLKLVQRLTGEAPSVIDKIDIVDLKAIIEVVSGFLDSGPKTGETS